MNLTIQIILRILLFKLGVNCALEYSNEHPTKSGVAVTLFLGSPRWFQNRFSIMIGLMNSVLPDSWNIQVIYKKNRMGREAITYSGVQRLVKRGKVILTAIPEAEGKLKRRDLFLSLWFWENIIADRVLIFGGNSIVCLNSQYNVDDFAHFEYIGSPWTELKGKGGDGGFSLRTRSRMIQIAKIREQQFSKTDVIQNNSIESYIDVQIRALQGKEDYIFVKSMDLLGVNLPGHADTIKFAMSGNVAEGRPFGALGTLSGLNDSKRTEYMEYCPELKIFYPTLHSSVCFGADPDPLKCFQYLCDYGGLKCRKDASITWKNVPRKADRGIKDITISMTITE